MSLIKSWVDNANDPNGHFPLNNLPMGAFSLNNNIPRCCTAIGGFVLDLSGLEEAGLLNVDGGKAFQTTNLNNFMDHGPNAWASVRDQLQMLLADDRQITADQTNAIKSFLFPLKAVQMHMPFRVSEYTDFYACKNHAVNVGTMFRGAENALPPNWLHIPIGYNGRASTVVASGTDIIRPNGQTTSPDQQLPVFGPCQRLDIELEMGAVVGQPSEMGSTVTVAEADAMIFGYVVLNDWSARDIQAWEYQPLGPFQAKAFATSISPWVITKEALEPFRVPTPERELPLLPYLAEPGPMLYDIELSIRLKASKDKAGTIISRTNSKELYYSAAQQLCHHASSGCSMNVGDLLGSGTISGPEKTTYGSLLEMSWGGENPIILPSGESRTFLEDGDTVILTGHAQGNGYRIGFGECTGTILPAIK